jgi:hypothetical protein
MGDFRLGDFTMDDWGLEAFVVDDFVVDDVADDLACGDFVLDDFDAGTFEVDSGDRAVRDFAMRDFDDADLLGVAPPNATARSAFFALASFTFFGADVRPRRPPAPEALRCFAFIAGASPGYGRSCESARA